MEHVEPETVCRSCGAPIRWVKTRTGKSMPVDFAGERRMVERERRHDPRLIDPVFEMRDTYVSHFATCPDAKRWRSQA